MKISLLFIAFIMVIVLSCKKENDSGKGRLTLYNTTSINDGLEKKVVIDGKDTVMVIRAINKPNCGDSVFNPIDLDAGSHHLLLISNGIAQGEINGVQIKANQCKLYPLYF